MRILDISVPLYPGCPAWPGDGDLVHEYVCSIAGGAASNTSRLAMPAHLGTHLDAPAHFVQSAATVERLDVGLFVGPALVVDLPSEPRVSAGALERAVADWPQRLLLRTRNSHPGGALSRGDFDREFCALTVEAAELIVERGVRLVGIDYYSIAPFGQGEPVHRIVLGAGVVALEGLDLRAVRPGRYTLSALPVKLVGFDGAPVRAVLIED